MHGRGLDTTRMRDALGFEPAFTTREAFEDFVYAVPRPLDSALHGMARVIEDTGLKVSNLAAAVPIGRDL